MVTRNYLDSGVFGRIHSKLTDDVAGPIFRPKNPQTTLIANLGNFGPIWLKFGGEG